MKNFYLTKAIKILTVAMLLIVTGTTNAQVNNIKPTPQPSVQQDINYSNKEFLSPQITQVQHMASGLTYEVSDNNETFQTKSASSGGTTYYVSGKNGDDSYPMGTESKPWKTLKPVNDGMSLGIFKSGDAILFERGSEFYGTIEVKCSGIKDNPIVFGAYGSGPKPIFKAAAIIHPRITGQDLHPVWVPLGNNKWSYKDDLTGLDVANLVLREKNSGNSSFGKKLMKANWHLLNEQGEFFYDFVKERIVIYSIGDPTTVYDTIQTVRNVNAIEFHLRNELDLEGHQFIVFENLDFRYFGRCVVEDRGSNCTYKNLDISYIGGADQFGDTEGRPYVARFGNGLQMWKGVHDVTITGCKIDNVYDAGITPQGISDDPYEVYNLFIRNNVISNCEFSFEFFERGNLRFNNPSTYNDDIKTYNIYFENNTCVNAGKGWSHNQRWGEINKDTSGPNPNGTHFRFEGLEGTSSNIFIRNNIFYGATEMLFWMIYPDDVVNNNNITIDYNCYYKDSDEFIGTFADAQAALVYKNFESFQEWQTATRKDANSIYSDPLFVSSIDFHLLPKSPLIGKGFDRGEGRYIGAFCPYYIGNKTLSSQAEVNNFHYPGITGSLTIGGNYSSYSNITHLSNLSNLVYVRGNLNIVYNAALTTLAGLQNLTTVGGDLVVWKNSLLTNLEGIGKNVKSLGGDLRIFDNPSLTSLEGLQNLTLVKGDLHINDDALLINVNGLKNLTSVEGELHIGGNKLLINLDGFKKLTKVGTSLWIQQNDLLTNLDGLQNLSSLGGGLLIYHNDLLTNIDNLQNLNSIGGSFEIYGNESLTNVNGFHNLAHIGGSLRLSNNASLTNIDGLKHLTAIEGELFISENDSLVNLDGLQHLTSVGFELVPIGWDDELRQPIFSKNSIEILNNFSLSSFCGLYTLLCNGGELPGKIVISGNAVEIDQPEICADGPCNSAGNTEVYSNTLNWGNQLAMPVTINVAGEIESIAIYHEGGNGNVLLGVYSDQGGFPSLRLGITASTAVNPSAGWQTIQITSPVEVITGQKVWLSWVFQNTPGIRYTEGTLGRAASANTWVNGMPSSFGPSTLAPYKYSVYCTYSTVNYPPDPISPVVTEFIIPSTSSSLTVPVNSFTATDNAGVKGYLLTEWATAPLAGDAGWSAFAPASFTFTTAGTKTLYAWAKDAAGNVSASLSAQVTITLTPDSEIPVGNTGLYGNTKMWGNQLAMPATFNAAGEIQSIAIYHEGGNGNVLLGVYSDQGGFPSSRLGITASAAVNPSAGWQTIQLTSPVEVITGQRVWLSWVFQNALGIRYTEGTPGRAASANTWVNGMPSSFGPSTLAPYKYSVYCTYSTVNYPPDAIIPVITEFIIPSTSSSLTVPVNSFTATDNTGVKGFLLTESATAPMVGDAGWSASAPASYTFTTTGTKILYAWAKDAGGNLSAGLSAQVTITLPSDSEIPFGNTGLYSNSIMWGAQLAMPVTFTEAGEIKSIAIYHEGGSGNVLLGVYSDQGGFPSSRLGTTASTAVNPSVGWQTIQLSSPVPVISGQKVWLSWVFQNAPGIRYTAGTPGRAASLNTWSNEMPASFGPSTIAPNKYSIYCNYFPDITKSGKIFTGNIMKIEKTDLRVYPNPFTDILRFEFVSPEPVNARIDLYDMTGRTVKTIFEQPIEGGENYEAEFKPETIISGMYFYRVTIGKSITNGKVVYNKQ